MKNLKSKTKKAPNERKQNCTIYNRISRTKGGKISLQNRFNFPFRNEKKNNFAVVFPVIYKKKER